MATPVRLIRNEFEFQERAAGREPPKDFRGKAAEAVSKAPFPHFSVVISPPMLGR